MGFDKPSSLCHLLVKNPPTIHPQVTTVPISVTTNWLYLFMYFMYFSTVLIFLGII